VADKYRRMIGNEIESGTHRLEPAYRRGHQAAIRDYHALRERRNYAITRAADVPRLPLPAPVDTPLFNKLAYIVLLIAFLAAVAIGTSLINWAFLVYGILAVILRQPSDQIFMAALVTLVIIPITSALQRGTLANDFSVMAFYFLVIGLIRASLELRHQSK
jgi:hypothetical protein